MLTYMYSTFICIKRGRCIKEGEGLDPFLLCSKQETVISYLCKNNTDKKNKFRKEKRRTTDAPFPLLTILMHIYN